MNKLKLITLLISSTFFVVPLAHSEDKLNENQVNSLIEQLTKSGKLDAAIDSGIKRYVHEQQVVAEKQRSLAEKSASESAKNARKVNPKRDHIFGKADAPFSFIVYSDLECPYCQRHNGVPEEVATLIGLDKMNVVFRHFPLPMHGEAAKKEAVASECVAKQAGNDGFFKFIKTVLKDTQLNGKGLKEGDAEIQRLAKDSGAKDEAAFLKCMQDVASQTPVKEDLEDGSGAGVTGTPGNIIRNNKNGKSIAVHGSPPGGAKGMEPMVKNALIEASKN